MSSTKIYYKLRNRGGGYQLPIISLKSLFISPPPNFFVNCIPNRLLRVSFTELFDFIIYQHLNKKTNILPLATFQIAHLCHQFMSLIMFALPVSKKRFKSIIFNQNSPKIKLFFQKNAKFLNAGGGAPDPRASGGWDLCPQTPGPWRLGASPPDPHWPPAAGGLLPDPQNSPTLRISGHAIPLL